MNWEYFGPALVGFGLGVIGGISIVCWLIIASHENFRKTFTANPKDK